VQPCHRWIDYWEVLISKIRRAVNNCGHGLVELVEQLSIFDPLLINDPFSVLPDRAEKLPKKAPQFSRSRSSSEGVQQAASLGAAFLSWQGFVTGSKGTTFLPAT
jgi:hypothetical protein